MGRPKPLLPFDGRTCLSLVAGACRGSRSDETVLVLGADADAVRAGLTEEDRERMIVAANEQHARGQTSSLKTGLEAASPRSDGFIVLPVDLPLVRAEDIDRLIERFETHPRGRTIFISTHEGRRGHPVLFSGVHRAGLLEMPDDDPLSAYVRLHEGEVDQVPADHEGVVLPMNTPEEYQHVLALWRAGRAKDEAAS
jgi:molybdenum cofactor cytidylyltransferase